MKSVVTTLLVIATHVAAAEGAVQWVWSGAVTSDSAVVKARVGSASDPRLVVGERTFAPSHVSSSGVATFRLDALQPSTEYVYRVEVGDASSLEGRLRTFDAGPMSFRFVFGSCARTASNSSVFETMESLDPLLFVHMGDFHYENIASNEVAEYRSAFDEVLASERQASLYRSTPIAYIWDDHDYGPNDSDGTHPGKPAALAAYDETVPHYPLVRDGEGRPTDVRQAFTVGRVRFVMTDVRSHRTPEGEPDGPDKTMLGVSQREWLLQELETAAESHEVIVWVNVVPWITEAGSGHGWGRYDWERRVIADRIRELGLVDRLIVLSGDAHMVAIDDGTNSNFATRAVSGERGFPVVHAAPLDRYARHKGGPYSHGKAARRILFGLIQIQQFGLADITDDGEIVELELTGRNKKGELLDGMSLRLRCQNGCTVVPADETLAAGVQ